MLGKFNRVVKSLRANKLSRTLVNLQFFGYLKETGWINSFSTGKPLDLNGDPLPWISLPAIAFLKDRLNSTMELFEYGCGQSTHFYANHVLVVDSVEHDKTWFDHINETKPVNARVTFRDLSTDAYENEIFSSEILYDIVVIDGRKRVKCCHTVIPALTEEGVIILDNSDREEYKPGIEYLKSQGFDEIPFWGMAPGHPENTCTSIFYRMENVLDI